MSQTDMFVSNTVMEKSFGSVYDNFGQIFDEKAGALFP